MIPGKMDIVSRQVRVVPCLFRTARFTNCSGLGLSPTNPHPEDFPLKWTKFMLRCEKNPHFAFASYEKMLN